MTVKADSSVPKTTDITMGYSGNDTTTIASNGDTKLWVDPNKYAKPVRFKNNYAGSIAPITTRIWPIRRQNWNNSVSTQTANGDFGRNDTVTQTRNHTGMDEDGVKSAYRFMFAEQFVNISARSSKTMRINKRPEFSSTPVFQQISIG